MGLIKPKATDLSYLVDSRIGNPDADYTEQVTDGGFDDASEWTLVSASISGSLLISDGGAASGAYQDIGCVTGKTYWFKLVIDSISSGSVWVYLGGATGTGKITQIGTAGTHYFVGTMKETTDTNLYVYGISSDAQIESISVKEWNGEELIPDPDVGFVANDVSKWTVYGSNTVEQDGNYTKTTYVNDPSGARVYLAQTIYGTTFNDLNNNKYKFVYRAYVNSGSTVRISYYNGSGWNTIRDISNTTAQIFIDDITIMSAGTPLIAFGQMGAGEVVWFEIISIMKVTGLVAAYNMIPNGSTLVDISGNGNNGVISNCPSSKDGLTSAGNASGAIVDIGVISDSSTIWTVNFVFDKYKQGNFDFIFGGDTRKNFVLHGGSGYLAFRDSVGDYLGWDGTGNTSEITSEMMETGRCIITLISTGNIIMAYFNGVDYGYISPATTQLYIETLVDGYNSTNAYQPEIELHDFQFFNYPFSEQEAINYHNSFETVEKYNNFTDHPVGSTIG